MRPEDWVRLKENFERFLDLEGDELDRLIAEVCQGNSKLADELRKLIAAHKVAQGFLSIPAIVPANAISPLPLFQSGELVASRFRIVRFIAGGGIGQVYEAEDLVLEERVALKAISPRAGTESASDLLKQEIQSARRVTHPNVCRIHDVVEHGGLMLMTMEFLPGTTLSQYLQEHGPIPRQAALQLIQQMAAGLQSAHDSGVIHRDFKPGNVMLTRGPSGLCVKITDFGLASPIGLSTKQPPLGAGTPGYMAPEQAAGGQVTPATDVYALGVVICDIAKARETDTSRSLPTPAGHASPVKDRCKELGRWRRVVERCIREDPAKRFQRPADVALALHGIERRRWQVPLLAACGSLTVLLVLISITLYRQRFAPAPSGAVIHSVAGATDRYQFFSTSPDGRWVAARDLKTRSLVLCDFRAAKIHSLVPNSASGRDVIWPLFSRDGSTIAYSRLEFSDHPGQPHAELRLVDIDGSNDRLLVGGPGITYLRPEDWFPDDSRILIRVAGTDRLMRLALVSAATGSMTPIVENAGAFELGKAIFSPDGTEAWFDRLLEAGKETSGIFAVRLDDHRQRTLIADASHNSLVGISSDGRQLIFLSDRNSENGLWTVRLVNGLPSGPAELAAADMGSLTPLGMTHANAFYYYQVLNSGGVYVATLNVIAGTTTAPRPVAPRLFKAQMNPSWSDNGRLCFFTLSTVGSMARRMFYVWEPNGLLREVSLAMDKFPQPQWRTRHSLVGFGTRKSQTGYFDVNAETGNAELLIPSQSLRDIRAGGAWSRDGNTLYNWEAEGNRLFRYDVRNRTRQILCILKHGMEVNPENLALSPDGETLAFISTESHFEKCALTLLSTRGGQPKPLWTMQRPEPLFIGSAIAWLPDSKILLVGLLRRGVCELWRVPTNGTAPARIQFPPLPNLSSLRVHPDGKTIAFSSSRQEKAELKVIENFLPRR